MTLLTLLLGRLTALLRRLTALVRRSQIDRDLEDEMRLHLELRAAQLRRDGATAGESHQAARRRFGSTLRLREEGLDSWGWRWLEQLAQDLRFAARSLVTHRGYALTAILTLGLGIGANTAIFSVLNGVVLKPLPYTNGERLLLVRHTAPGFSAANPGVAVNEFYDYRRQAQSFDALVEYHQMFFDLLRRGAPDRVDVGVVAHNFFSVLGIEPLLGRDFRPSDDAQGAAAVLILSYSYWQEKFGGDPRIVGQVFEMNDRPHTVVGVLPNVPHYPQENDVYMPVASCPFRARAEENSKTDRRAFQILSVFGRLKPGVTREEAARELDVICGRFVAEHPSVYPKAAGFAVTAPMVREELVRDAEPLLLILLGTTGLVLLIACANVANLAVARLLRRDRELGLRAALGAGRARIVRQLLTESTLLSIVGGAAGLLVALPAISLLTAYVGQFTSRTSEIAVDGRVLAFTLLVSVLSGITFGTVPAVVARLDLAVLTRTGQLVEIRLRRRLRNSLVVAQVAVSVVLLTGAGLLLASAYRLGRVEVGYQTEQVVSAEAFGTFSKYASREAFLDFYQTALDRLEAEPRVLAAAVTNATPLAGVSPQTVRFRINGRAPVIETLPKADVVLASAGYFETLGIPLRTGRAFSASDRIGAQPVAIVNETMARQWRDAPVIGSTLTINGREWLTIIGIAADVRQWSLDRAGPLLYVPLLQGPASNGQFLVRTPDDLETAAATITRTVHAIDADMPVENVSTLEGLRTDQLRRPQVMAALLTIFAAVALAVTLTGIAGVMALHVSHRRNEFGVRMALGARPAQVVRPVLCNGLCLVGAGLLLGVGAAALTTGVLSAYLFETTPTDPLAFGAVVLGLLVAGCAACLGPAWRATRVDPQVVFRAD